MKHLNIRIKNLSKILDKNFISSKIIKNHTDHEITILETLILIRLPDSQSYQWYLDKPDQGIPSEGLIEGRLYDGTTLKYLHDYDNLFTYEIIKQGSNRYENKIGEIIELHIDEVEEFTKVTKGKIEKV